MCQANLTGHWLDGASSLEERQRRLAALRGLGTENVEPWGTYWSYPGPAVLKLVAEWNLGHP